jgi:starch phosphorylase
MWAHVPEAPPIGAITNGIHRPTWTDAEMSRLADEGTDDELWARHLTHKQALVAYVEAKTGQRLRDDRLIVGFARRAVAYKRAPLIFQDTETIAPLLESGRLQLVFSGKSHPLDQGGRDIVGTLVEMTRRYPESVAFVPDYSMETGRVLTRGADVWLNNPRRPQEASGTSGMKAAMNGVLNASTLDGWWPEACRDGVNGWQIGGGFESDDLAELDAHDLAALVETVAGRIVPTYYDDHDTWSAMMRASIRDTRDAFSVERMLREYVEQLYTA